MFIAENVKLISNLNLKGILDAKLRDYYIKIRVVYDKSITKSEKKTFSQNDSIYKSTMYEADKNYAHKDEDYIPTELEFKELIDTLKERLEHCREICDSKLPQIMTIDYVPYDRDLYRFMKHITPDVEEELQKQLYPNFTKTFKELAGKKYKSFNDIEDIKTINNPGDYGVIMRCGLNFYEGLQERQDGCIKINVLFDLDTWCSIKK